MSEEYDPSSITQHPVPPVRQLEDGRALREWRLELASPVASGKLEGISAILSGEAIHIDVSTLNPATVNLIVTSAPGLAYDKVWDATFRAMLLLERRLGEIVSIEGEPRHTWKLQFVITEHVGALDKDKTPLILAAERGDLTAVREILNAEHKLNIDEASPSNRTALSYAASRGHPEVVAELLERGASVNLAGELTILEAGTFGGIEVVEALLGAGADVNATNRYGETALMSAAASGYASIVRLLIGKGADLHRRDSTGETALQKATRNKRIEVVALLRQAGATE